MHRADLDNPASPTTPGAQDLSDNTLRIARTFHAPAQAVFDAWTSEEVLRRWFYGQPGWETSEADVDLRVGGKVRLVMRDPEKDEEFGGSGHYTEIDPPNRLAFTWIWDHNPTRTLIVIDFEEVDGVTTVHFAHSDLWDEEAVRDHESGWHNCFANLERALEEAGSGRRAASQACGASYSAAAIATPARATTAGWPPVNEAPETLPGAGGPGCPGAVGPASCAGEGVLRPPVSRSRDGLLEALDVRGSRRRARGSARSAPCRACSPRPRRSARDGRPHATPGRRRRLCVARGSTCVMFMLRFRLAASNRLPGVRGCGSRPDRGPDRARVSPQLTAEHRDDHEASSWQTIPRRSKSDQPPPFSLHRRLRRRRRLSAAVATAASARPTRRPLLATCSIRGRTRPTAGSTSSCMRPASRSTRVRRTAPGSSPIRRRRSTRRRALRSRSVPIFSTSTGRPVWQFQGGSSVEAARTRRARRRRTGHIAWLLLQAVATSPGRLGHTTWIKG